MKPEEYAGYAPQQPEHGGSYHEAESPVRYVERFRLAGKVLNNLWPTLTGNATDGYKLAMTLGHIDARKHTGDAALPLAITNIPGQPDPIADALTVASGDKIFCEISESSSGVATAAEIKKATTWPTSAAASLAGGSNSTGATGKRNIRLCEIITEDGLVKVKTYHSGNIAHFQPELAENTVTGSPTPGTGARLLKQWRTSTGQWLVKFLKKGNGQATITESADEVEIRGTKKDSVVATYRGEALEASTFLEFQDGFEISGDESEGNEDPPVPPAEKDLYIPTVEAWDDPDAQIAVENIAGGAAYRYQVRGNNQFGTLSYTVGSGSPVTVLEWKDGLVITETSSEIPIPSGGSEGSHPWKCTPTGTDVIDVAPGCIFFPVAEGDPGTDMIPFVYHPEEYGGGSLTVTAEGYIYAVVGANGSPEMVGGIEAAFGTASNLVVFVRGFDVISLIFSADVAPDFSDYLLVYKVAKVTVAAGVASVIKQYLTHNPTHELIYVTQDT
jgi:hypothetical protein